MTAEDHATIYDDLMRFKPDGLTPNGWAILAGVSRTVWADMRRHGNPSRRTLQKLLDAAGSSLAEFEALRISSGSAADMSSASGLADRNASWGAPKNPPLPLIASAPGGSWKDGDGIELTELQPQEIAGSVPRPDSLAFDPSAYAVRVVGDSMWPRFRPGRVIAVSALSPAAVGDDVVVKLKSAGCDRIPTLIKEFVHKSADGVKLRQFNPDLTFPVPASAIVAIEKVLGELV